MSVYKDKKTKNWVVTLRYTDLNGQEKRRAKRGFKTKREAVEWEREFLSGIEEQEQIDMKFKDFYITYMDDLSNHLKFTTIRNKRYMIDYHILPFFGEMEMTKISAKDILRWQNEIKGKNYSQTFERSLSNQVHAIFNHASKYYGLKDSPIRVVKPMGKSHAEKMNFWTKEEFDQFISVIDNEVTRLNYYVLFYTGIRIGELMAIKLKDIDFNRGHIDINETALYENQKYIFSKPKTPKSIRIVTIPLFLTQMIKKYVEDYYFIDMDEQVFPIAKDRLRKDMVKYSKLAGVKFIRTHDLRHSHASLLIEQGIQPNIVQERLGHEKIETTLRTYSHLYPNKQYHLADFLNTIGTGNNNHIIAASPENENPLMISTTK